MSICLQKKLILTDSVQTPNNCYNFFHLSITSKLNEVYINNSFTTCSMVPTTGLWKLLVKGCKYYSHMFWFLFYRFRSWEYDFIYHFIVISLFLDCLGNQSRLWERKPTVTAKPTNTGNMKWGIDAFSFKQISMR